jgi:hypothetical protein
LRFRKAEAASRFRSRRATFFGSLDSPLAAAAVVPDGGCEAVDEDGEGGEGADVPPVEGPATAAAATGEVFFLGMPSGSVE